MRKLCEVVAVLALIATAWLAYGAVYGPGRLPDRIPTHFDATGNPNGWGSPSMMMLMPVIALSLYLSLTIAARFPAAFHYPIRTTPQLLPRLQSITLDMLALLKAELTCLFAALQWIFIRAARTGEGHMFAAILPVVMVVILGTVAWYIFAVVRIAAARSEA